MKTYQTIFGILLHVTLIAIFEILFYFLYICKIEKQATDNQVSCLLPKKFIGKKLDEEELREFLKKEGVDKTKIEEIIQEAKNANDLIKYLTGITHKKALESKKEREAHNNKLHVTGGIIAGVLILGTLSWYLLGPLIVKQRNFKVDWFEIVFSLTLIILLVAIFEIVLVETIVLKYGVTSAEETKEILVDTMNGKNTCK